MIGAIFLLLVLFQIKHLLCDYFWQNDYMKKKFLPGREYILPLSAHAATHAYATMIISMIFLLTLLPPGNDSSVAIIALVLAVLDFMIHFAVDRIKAHPKLGGRWKAVSAEEYRALKRMVADAAEEAPHPEIKLAADMAKRKLQNNEKFWWALGTDQFAHHITHYIIVFVLIKIVYL